MSDKKVLLEQDARFSQSMLWQCQSDYFERSGIDAWAQGSVPYYITCNTLIAHSYAQIVFRYIQDNLRLGNIDINHPVYMFELGTGSGKFSYLFLRQFSELLKHYHMQDLKFRYIMTDFTESNFKYWAEHKQFKEFLDQGILDFAIYRIGEKQSVHLVNNNLTLTEGSSKNPVLAVGNYIFDTVTHDVFRVSGKRLEEGLITAQTPESNVKFGEVVDLNQLETHFNFHEITLPYYHDEHLDGVLSYYHENLNEGTFLVPTGGIASIDALRAISHNRLFMITGDKGYTSLSSMEGMGAPHIAFHGSFSMMVNFDFVHRYICHLGGDALIAEDYEGFKISAFSMGESFNNMPETVWAYDEFNRHLSTKEFLILKNKVIENVSNLTIEQIFALLKFSYFDPDIFMSIVSRLLELMPEASQAYVNAIRGGLDRIHANYYFMLNNKNVPFELGRLYYLTGELDKAIVHYDWAMTFGEDSANYFNMGLCYYYKHELQRALHHFKMALSIKPDDSMAQDWVKLIEKELA